MSAKDWLNRGYRISKEIETKEAVLETMLKIVSKTETSGSQINHTQNTNEASFIRWSELKNNIDRLKTELISIDQETDDFLRQLPNPDEYRILYCRYVRRMDWRDIRRTFPQLKEATMFRLHSRGIKHISELTTHEFDRYI